ncbi:MAG: NADH-ubiquinone oxidoreductase-F iron-sulfur binding region domain-containing protein [Actinomycetota bacterium]
MPARPASGKLLQLIGSVEAYQAAGGGEGLRRAIEIGPDASINLIRQAGLRGRGGAGFPTGIKWRGVADAPPDQRRFLVCNAAEGEPGTFKDRALMRANPYQLLEGLAIGGYAIGATETYIGIKAKYELEAAQLEKAATEMAGAGLLGEIPIRIVTGPDDYLLGEEKGLLEAIEGRDPLPRWYPPYILGLHTGTSQGVGAASVGADDRYNPTVVNNVETLANVPHILREGAAWFRSMGTEDSPGSMVFTVCGDVENEVVVDLPFGTPLSWLIYGPGGGVGTNRKVKAVFPGVSNSPIPADLLDTPLEFGAMRAIGSGLGSGGMIVYDDTACIVAATAVLSRFLAIESCGQCPPCKLGTGAFSDRFRLLEEGAADAGTLEEVQAWLGRVTDANRCGLGAGGQALVAGVLRVFTDEVVSHLGRSCWSERILRIPKLVDWAPELNRFVYDETYFEWRSP